MELKPVVYCGTARGCNASLCNHPTSCANMHDIPLVLLPERLIIPPLIIVIAMLLISPVCMQVFVFGTCTVYGCSFRKYNEHGAISSKIISIENHHKIGHSIDLTFLFYIIIYFFFYFRFFPFFSPNLVANLFQSPMLLSIHRNGPVAWRPGRSRILESDAPSPSRIISSFTRDRNSETIVSSALLYTAIQQPLLSPPPPLEWRANYATPFRAGQTQPLAGLGFETPTLGV